MSVFVNNQTSFPEAFGVHSMDVPGFKSVLPLDVPGFDSELLCFQKVIILDFKIDLYNRI